MPEVTEDKKIKESLLKIIPNSLLEVIGSDDTSLHISEICLENGVVQEEKIEEVGYRVGLVLLGKLPPEELPKALEENLKIEPGIAKKISEEANHIIFSPVKNDLAKLYKKEVPSEKPKEEPKRPPRKDIYHEPIE